MSGTDPAPRPPGPPSPEPGPDTGPAGARPIIERVGLAAIAMVLAGLFATVAVAAWAGGEGFLATMAGIGAGMTAWAGARTLLRG